MQEDKDRKIYKAIIKSTTVSHADIARVFYLMRKDTYKAKMYQKQRKKLVMYEKSKDNVWSECFPIEIQHKMANELISWYNRTSKHLFANAFNDNDELIKPHYLELVKKLMTITNQLNKPGFRSMVYSIFVQMLAVDELSS